MASIDRARLAGKQEGQQIMTPIKVGQALYFVHWSDAGDFRENQLVTVTQRGRDWAKLSNGASINAETLVSSEHGLRGKCYLTEAAYNEEFAVSSMWNDLALAMSGPVPQGVTRADITVAARILRVKNSGWT